MALTIVDYTRLLDEDLAAAVRAYREAERLLQRARLRLVHLISLAHRATGNPFEQPYQPAKIGTLTAASVEDAKREVSEACRHGRHEGQPRKKGGWTCRRPWCQCLCHHRLLQVDAGLIKIPLNEKMKLQLVTDGSGDGGFNTETARWAAGILPEKKKVQRTKKKTGQRKRR